MIFAKIVVEPPAIIATKSNSNKPTNNQFSPPTINKVNAIASKVDKAK